MFSAPKLRQVILICSLCSFFTQFFKIDAQLILVLSCCSNFVATKHSQAAWASIRCYEVSSNCKKISWLPVVIVSISVIAWKQSFFSVVPATCCLSPTLVEGCMFLLISFLYTYVQVIEGMLATTIDLFSKNSPRPPIYEQFINTTKTFLQAILKLSKNIGIMFSEGFAYIVKKCSIKRPKILR